jgi:hypothetical protein
MDGNANSVSNHLDDPTSATASHKNKVPGLSRKNKKSSRSLLLLLFTADLCFCQFCGSAMTYLDAVSFPDFTTLLINLKKFGES